MDNGKYVTIEREFNAPVELVWKMWTEPEMVKKWWGPTHYSAPTVDMDFRVGGKYNFAMLGPDGKTNYSGGTYTEIIPHRKIVSTDSFTDKDGNQISPTEVGMGETFPQEMTLVLTFEEVNGKTRMTLKHGDITGMAEEMEKGMTMGWNQSLDKIDTYFEDMTKKTV